MSALVRSFTRHMPTSGMTWGGGPAGIGDDDGGLHGAPTPFPRQGRRSIGAVKRAELLDG